MMQVLESHGKPPRRGAVVLDRRRCPAGGRRGGHGLRRRQVVHRLEDAGAGGTTTTTVTRWPNRSPSPPPRPPRATTRGLERRHQHHVLLPGHARHGHADTVPAVAGTWVQASPTTIRYDLAAPLIPASNEVVTIPGGPSGIRANDGATLPAAASFGFTVADGDVLRLQELLAAAQLPSRLVHAHRGGAAGAPGHGRASRHLRLALADPAGRADLAVDPGRRDRHHQGGGGDVREPERPDRRRAGRAPGVDHAPGRRRREQGGHGARTLRAGVEGPAREPHPVQQRRGPVHEHPRQHRCARRRHGGRHLSPSSSTSRLRR